MSVASEITRLQNAKASLKTSINAKTDAQHQIDDETLDDYADFIDSIQTGGGPVVEPEEKDVNFYDYDGTRVYSYTKNEFLALEQMPENPSHDGLTAQGWNWSFQDATDYVTSYGKLDVGETYITDDGDTRIYITLEKGRTSPYLGIAIAGEVEVDWGDGSQKQSITGTSTQIPINAQHNYNSAGDYVIKIKPIDNASIYFVGESGFSKVLWSNELGTKNSTYNNAITKVEIGNNAEMNSYAFRNCYSLLSVTIPNYISEIYLYTFSTCSSLKSVIIPSNVSILNNYAFSYCSELTNIVLPKKVTAFGNYLFTSCSILKTITIPNSVTSIGNNIFSYCYSLVDVTIPNSITNINSNFLNSCYSLTNLKIPSSVTTVSSSAFQICSCMAYYDFSSHTTIPTLSSTNAFNGIPSDCKIIVPDNLYTNWKAANNWSYYADFIISKSDWDALQGS